MKKYNKLSFILPCYNCANTVLESLDSIYNQKLNIDFEVVCTEDGSTDDTKKVLEKYKKEKHQDLKIFYHPRNMGEALSANTCAINTRGDIIFRLDADNVLEDGSIQPLINLLEETGEGAASFSFYKNFYVLGKETGKWIYRHNNGFCDFTNVITNNSVPPASGNYLFTKESYIKSGGYPVGHGMASWGFGFRQLANGYRIAILNNSFYWHRLSPDSEWWRGQARNTNDIDCKNFVLEYKDLFTEESVKWLNGNDNFFMGINSGKLRLK